MYQVNYSSLKEAPTYHDKLDVIRSFNFFNRDYHLLRITSDAAKKLAEPRDYSYKRTIEFLDDNIPYSISTDMAGRTFKDIVTLDSLLLKGGDGKNFIFKNKTNQILLDRLFQFFNGKSLPDNINQLHLCVIFNQIHLVKKNQEDFAKIIHSTESDEGKSSLNMAAIYGYVDWVPLLIEMGADVNQSNRLGQTSILLAARYGHEHIAQILIEKGAYFHFADGTSSTPLHWAAKNNQAGIVQLLITKGADSRAKGTYQKSPIHLAAENGCADAFNALIYRNKIQIKLKDRDDNEPIHLAAKAGHESIIHIIAKIGHENLLTKNAYGKTPLELAWQNQQTEVVAGILGYTSNTVDDVNSLILTYKKNSSDFIMKLILEFEARNDDNLKYLIQFLKQHIIKLFGKYIDGVKKESDAYTKDGLLRSERKAATYYCYNKVSFILQSKKSLNIIFDAISYFFHMVSLMRLPKANINYDSDNAITWPALFEPYFKAMVHKAEKEENKNTLLLRLK